MHGDPTVRVRVTKIVQAANGFPYTVSVHFVAQKADAIHTASFEVYSNDWPG